MREYAKKPESQSRTLDRNPKASRQAPIDLILQRYKERNIQRFAEDEELIQGKFETAQREEIDEDELLQGKFSDTVQLLREEGSKLLERGKEDKLRQELAEELKIKDKGHSRHKGSYDPEGDSPEKILTNLTKPCFDRSAKYAEGEAVIQREEIDEEELLQGKFATFTTQREEIPSEGGEANLTGMPDNLKSGIESLSGYSMDDVRVHYNSSKPAQLQALAYAQGTDIHIAPGQEQHLPHEAWHVVQQKQGRVQPTTQLQGVNVNDNEGLEKEADRIGGKAAQMNFNKNLFHPLNNGIISKTAQCTLKGELESKLEVNFKKDIDDYLTLNFMQKNILWREVRVSSKEYHRYDDIISDVKNNIISLLPYPFQSSSGFEEMIMAAHNSTDDIGVDLSLYGTAKVISDFYRGDNRESLEIIGTDESPGVGFSAFGQLTPEKARYIVSLWINQHYLSRSDFTMKWKYPTQRANLAKNAIPGIATSLTDARLGENFYKIVIPTMKFIEIESNKKVGYDGEDINSSTILALQIDANEVVFLNHIPPQYINSID